MSRRSRRGGPLAGHHLLALLGLGILSTGLWLGWQLNQDAAKVDARVLQVRQASPQPLTALSLHEAQRALLRRSRTHRLATLSHLIEALGLFLVIGAGLLSRLRNELAGWTLSSGLGDDSDEPPSKGSRVKKDNDENQGDPPSRRHAA